MKIFVKFLLFNVAVIGFFLYVGNSIPQQRKDPPKELKLSPDMAPAKFVKIGQEIFYGKGQRDSPRGTGSASPPTEMVPGLSRS